MFYVVTWLLLGRFLLILLLYMFLVLSCFIRIYLLIYLFRQQNHPVEIASNSFCVKESLES